MSERSQAELMASLLRHHPDASHMLGMLQRRSRGGVPAETDRKPDRSVGVFEEDGASPGLWRRVKDPIGMWRTWADVDGFQLSAKARRIAYLGESVARGFLYDPHFNPALMLQRGLNAREEERVQIIDLARANMGFFELLDLIDRVTVLEPDGLIVFCGNNWLFSGDVFSFYDPARLPLALLDGGFDAFRSEVTRALHRMADVLLEKLEALARRGTVPLLVLPEFNLGDWVPGTINVPPFLVGDGLEGWLRLRTAAAAALAAGNGGELEAVSQEMIDLDGGTCGHSLWLAGRAKRLSGQMQEAYDCFVAAKDTAAVLPIPQVPSPHSAIGAALRDGAAARGIGLVDLPRLLKDHARDGIPGRDLFLDYCHLDARGMLLAVSAIIDGLPRALGLGPIDLDECMAPMMETASDPDAEASARLLAAVHNANWGQPSEIIGFHCDLALRASPKAAKWATRLLDFETRRQPRWSSASFSSFDVRQVGRYMNFYVTPHLADFLLKQELNAALSRVEGEGVVERWTDLLIAEHAVGASGVDLLDPAYSARFHSEGRPFSDNPAFYQACDDRSTFFVVCDGPVDLELDVVWRATTPDRTSDLQLSFNGTTIGRPALEPRWRRDRVRVPCEMVRRGVNVVVILWPTPGTDRTALLRRAADDMLRRRGPEFIAVFGQIHHFRVHTGPA